MKKTSREGYLEAGEAQRSGGGIADDQVIVNHEDPRLAKG
jgi:hypothetical protein